MDLHIQMKALLFVAQQHVNQPKWNKLSVKFTIKLMMVRQMHWNTPKHQQHSFLVLIRKKCKIRVNTVTVGTLEWLSALSCPACCHRLLAARSLSRSCWGNQFMACWPLFLSATVLVTELMKSLIAVSQMLSTSLAWRTFDSAVDSSISRPTVRKCC